MVAGFAFFEELFDSVPGITVLAVPEKVANHHEVKLQAFGLCHSQDCASQAFADLKSAPCQS